MAVQKISLHCIKMFRKGTKARHEIAYRCACVGFFKSCACEHAILATVMLDKIIEIPAKHCLDRPSAPYIRV